MSTNNTLGTGAALVAVGLLSGCGSKSGAGSQAGGGLAGAGTPSVSADAMGATAAARLLMQGTFGATPDLIASAARQSYDEWFAGQAALSPSLELPQIPHWNSSHFPAWWNNAVNGPDQLRLRVAFALSQIFVVSRVDQYLFPRGQALGSYYDQLNVHALGSFRAILDVVSRSPVMGIYLTYMKNQKANPATHVHADENYARELMQLMTIGLWKLNDDGTQQLDGSGNPIPTYGQADVLAMARVFTGWDSKPTLGQTGEAAWRDQGASNADVLHPMVPYEPHHDTGEKSLLGTTIAAGGTCESDLKAALDTLFSHPNVGPFIGKQLIQRFVTSNPSADYVSRVAAAFADDGTGARGNMLALIKAILTDPEATSAGSGAGSGKLREPVIRLTNLWRAFSAAAPDGTIGAQITGTAATDFGQNALSSPTVFNFYRPDFQMTGPLAQAGLVAPEFQITNEYSIVQTSNDLQWQAYMYVDSSGKVTAGMDSPMAPSSKDVLLHTAAWEPLAADPGTLVDNLNLVFMAGQMPSAMRATLLSYVSAIPATEPAARAVEAAQLVINSPQYAIQR